MIEQPFRLETASGRPLHGIVSLPERGGRRPVVVIAHGFKGFMEWGFFPAAAELLANRGFAAVRFNFWGSGMQPGDELVTDPQAFHDNTYGHELEDLSTVLQALDEGLGEVGSGKIDANNIGLLGHSRGGGVSILTAAKAMWNERVRALVTWGSIARVDYVAEDRRKLWQQQGELEVVNGRTGQRLRLGPELLAEVEPPTAPHLDIPAAAAQRAAAWLQIHGELDEAIPLAEAHRLAEAAKVGAGEADPGIHQLKVIDGASHTFGSRHPFVGPTPALIEALNATQTWFRQHLGTGS